MQMRPFRSHSTDCSYDALEPPLRGAASNESSGAKAILLGMDQTQRPSYSLVYDALRRTTPRRTRLRVVGAMMRVANSEKLVVRTKIGMGTEMET